MKTPGFQLMTLSLAACAAVYARTALGPLQENIRVSLTLSDTQMAVLQGPALALPLLLSAVPLGILADRISRVRVLLFALSLAALASLWTATASSFTSLLLARALVGIATPASSVLTASLISDLFSPDRRGRANTSVAVAQVIGMSAAFALGGWLQGGALGSDREVWRRAMAWLTAPILLVIVPVVLMREPTRAELRRRSTPRGGIVGNLWDYRAQILPLLIGATLVAIADGAALIWLTPMLVRQFGLSASSAGQLMAGVLLISGVLGPMAGGVIADHCERRGGPTKTWGALTVIAALSAVMGLFPCASAIHWAVLPMLLFLSLGAAVNVIVTALLTIVVPNDLRGLCLSVLWAGAALLGLGVAPVLVSLISMLIGGAGALGRALATVCVATGALGAASFARGARRLHPASA